MAKVYIERNNFRNIRYQYMPNIFISSFERTKSYADTQRAMTAPIVARRNIYFPDRLSFTTINGQLNFFTDVITESRFQYVVILILKTRQRKTRYRNTNTMEKRLRWFYKSSGADCDDEIEKCFESGSFTRRVLLYLKHEQSRLAMNRASFEYVERYTIYF